MTFKQWLLDRRTLITLALFVWIFWQASSINNWNLTRVRYWRNLAKSLHATCRDIGKPIDMSEFERVTGLKGDPWKLDTFKDGIGCNNKFEWGITYDPDMDEPD